MYCSVQDVRDASELLESAAVIPDEKISPVIQKSQGRIDSVLKSRYVVPLSIVPEIIKSIAQDMAAGFLLANVFSNQLGQEQINLSNQFLRRADSDLARVIEEQQLDGLPGISWSPNREAPLPLPSAAPANGPARSRRLYKNGNCSGKSRRFGRGHECHNQHGRPG